MNFYVVEQLGQYKKPFHFKINISLMYEAACYRLVYPVSRTVTVLTKLFVTQIFFLKAGLPYAGSFTSDEEPYP